MTVDPGLCAGCLHAHMVTGARSTFWRCGRSDAEVRFPRYPRLPVRNCPGFEPGAVHTDSEPDGSDPPGTGTA